MYTGESKYSNVYDEAAGNLPGLKSAYGRALWSSGRSYDEIMKAYGGALSLLDLYEEWQQKQNEIERQINKQAEWRETWGKLEAEENVINKKFRQEEEEAAAITKGIERYYGIKEKEKALGLPQGDVIEPFETRHLYYPDIDKQTVIKSPPQRKKVIRPQRQPTMKEIDSFWK